MKKILFNTRVEIFIWNKITIVALLVTLEITVRLSQLQMKVPALNGIVKIKHSSINVFRHMNEKFQGEIN